MARVTRGNRSVMVQFIDVIAYGDIPYARSKGIVIDLAHLSDPGVWEVLELSEDPVIWSHIDIRSGSPGYRAGLTEIDPTRGIPAGAFGVTNRPDQLLNLVLDALARTRPLA